MKYKMAVTIYNPKAEAGMNSDLVYIMECEFTYNPDTYGNGYYVLISADTFENFYDLRYDDSFHKDKPEVWLANWAYTYWSGKNGAYDVKRLCIEKM